MVWNERSLPLLVDGKQEGFLCVWPYLATTGSTFLSIILYDVRNIFCPSGFINQTLPAFVFLPYFPLFHPCALPCSLVVVTFLILRV